MILVAESGSTKTDWQLLTPTGRQAFQTEGINPYYQSADDISGLLAADLHPHLAGSLQGIYYYGTGITDDTRRAVLAEAFKQVFGEIDVIKIESDLIGAAVGLFGEQAGIACILGTGSNSGFFDGQKLAFQIPPLGFWLGDEGSGGHLGKLLLLSYLHKTMPLPIQEAFEEKYGILNRLPVLERAYKQPFPNRYFASFTPFIAAHRSTAFCQHLLHDSFKLFFKNYLLKYPQLHSQKVGFVGSVAAVFEPELRAVAARYGLQELKILKSPMEGLVTFHENKLLTH